MHGAGQAKPASAHPWFGGWQRCTNPVLRYTIAYPRHWHTAQVRPSEVCRQFDRRPFTVPQNAEYPITALNAVPVPVSLRQYVAGTTDPMFAVTKSVRHTRVAGRAAVRFEVVSTGEGLYPKGTRTYGYAFSRAGATFVVFTMTLPGDRRYRQNKAVVDVAAATLRLR